MITRVESYGETHLINAKATIAHPMADEVSIAIGNGAYARFPHSVELAFFKNGEWVTDPLPEFAALYSHEVYPYVPLIYFAQFMENYATGKE
jgi:hypothetical protein